MYAEICMNICVSIMGIVKAKIRGEQINNFHCILWHFSASLTHTFNNKSYIENSRPKTCI